MRGKRICNWLKKKIERKKLFDIIMLPSSVIDNIKKDTNDEFFLTEKKNFFLIVSAILIVFWSFKSHLIHWLKMFRWTKTLSLVVLLMEFITSSLQHCPISEDLPLTVVLEFGKEALRSCLWWGLLSWIGLGYDWRREHFGHD